MPKIKYLLFVAALFLLVNTIQAQTRTITGKIMSAANEMQPGASVLIKGTTKGTISDANGRYSLSVPSGDVSLIVSLIGFDKLEKVVSANATELNFTLSESSGNLSEVVVTALGISREKKTLVYATQQLKPTELTEVRDANNFIGSLQGKIAGAVIQQGSGGVGSGARIVLRGNRFIQGNNNALIVVDGVPINNGSNGPGSDFGGVQSSDGAMDINPDDIESSTVLRGASAAALYGSQAANGVLIITTKKGKKDKVSVTINSGFSTEKAWALPFFQNEYGQGNDGKLDPTRGESWGAKMTGQSYTDHLGNPATYSPQPDNVKNFFRTGASLNNSIGISGGSDKMQTYFSYTNANLKGYLSNNELKRHTVNLRITNQISSRFSTDAKITYVNHDIQGRPLNGESNAPVINIYNVARSFTTAQLSNFEKLNNVGIPTATNFPSTLSSIYQNPYWMTNRYNIEENRDRIIGFLSATYKLTDWLSVIGKANLDKMSTVGQTQVHEGTILFTRPGGNLSVDNGTGTSTWYEARLEGKNSITSDLKVDYRVGAILNRGFGSYYSINTNGLNVTNKFSSSFAKAPQVSQGADEVEKQALFGQANFGYKDKLFLDMSVRQDWESTLPPPHSFFYPSIGVSAILSEMIKLPAAFTFLKTNFNYAQVGNGAQFALLNPIYQYSSGAGVGFLQRGGTLPFPELKPEITKSLEFGVEARFLQNRLGLTVNIYKSNSFNQLLRIALPQATGYSSQYINAGNIQNKGLEIVLDGTIVQGSDFNWTTTLNFATNTNDVIALDPNIKRTFLGDGFARSATPIVEEGAKFGDLFGTTWARNPAGQFLVTKEGLPLIDNKNQKNLGNFNPKANFGFTNTFTFKGFSARVLVDGRIGGVVMAGGEMNLAASGISEGTAKYREGGWNLGGVDEKGQKVDAKINSQQFWQIASGKRYGNAEFFMYDATNIRIREFSLGYQIPLKNNKYINGAKLSLVGRNLAFLYRGKSILDIPGLGKRTLPFDPDMSLASTNFQGVEYANNPSTQTMGVNLQLSF